MNWNDFKFWFCVVGSVIDSYLFMVFRQFPATEGSAKMFLFGAVMFAIGGYGAYQKEKHDAFLEENNKKK